MNQIEYNEENQPEFKGRSFHGFKIQSYGIIKNENQEALQPQKTGKKVTNVMTARQ